MQDCTFCFHLLQCSCIRKVSFHSQCGEEWLQRPITLSVYKQHVSVMLRSKLILKTKHRIKSAKMRQKMLYKLICFIFLLHSIPTVSSLPHTERIKPLISDSLTFIGQYYLQYPHRAHWSTFSFGYLSPSESQI